MIVVSNKSGQLGNQLITFSHLIAVARKHDLQILNLAFGPYAEYFQTTSKDLLCRYPPQKTIVTLAALRSLLFGLNKMTFKAMTSLAMKTSAVHNIVVADSPEYDFKNHKFYDMSNVDFLRMAKEKAFVYLFGRFFRDFEDLALFSDEIRAFFRPIKSIQSNIDRLMLQAKSNCDILVGVHIRRGDYKQYEGGIYYYTPAQYRGVMDELLESSPGKRVKFLVCSNEAIDDEVFNGTDVLKSTGHLVEDLYALASCDFIMGPPSSYTRWAAFYGQKPLYKIKFPAKRLTIGSFERCTSDVLLNLSAD